ncbi:hypothetical protein [Mycobacterium sp. SMC-17]|uniref:hypothetical protein n=1 Tax=Mycobacterium sp. SMC-17 TaxID=3381628 RepID=UPI003876D515
MTAGDYDDAMARARAALAALKRAAAELTANDADPGVVLHHLRDDLHRQDAPSVAQRTRR